MVSEKKLPQLIITLAVILCALGLLSTFFKYQNSVKNRELDQQRREQDQQQWEQEYEQRGRDYEQREKHHQERMSKNK